MHESWRRVEVPRSTARLNRCLAVVSLAAISVFTPVPAAAQTAPHGDDWRFKLTPYFWATGLEGDVGIGRVPSVQVDASFSDIWNELDIGVMGMFEARKGRWGILFDGFYAELSPSAKTPGPLFGEAKLDLVQQIYSLAGAYRVVDGPALLDVVAGLRYVYVKSDLELTPGLAAGRSASRREDWIDGFAGLRGEYFFTDRWSVLGYVDMGGGRSDLAWQALAGVNYQFSNTLDLQLGYRNLSIDYDRGSGGNRFLYDTDMSGPYLSLGIQF